MNEEAGAMQLGARASPSPDVENDSSGGRLHLGIGGSRAAGHAGHQAGAGYRQDRRVRTGPYRCVPVGVGERVRAAVAIGSIGNLLYSRCSDRKSIYAAGIALVSASQRGQGIGCRSHGAGREARRCRNCLDRGGCIYGDCSRIDR